MPPARSTPPIRVATEVRRWAVVPAADPGEPLSMQGAGEVPSPRAAASTPARSASKK
eukprot:CAMPEP_0204200024 /NCGR_PEP_ID=MMETSP0361-20130328/66436_1 /ASSEMBLY_ACC=CAM_ASM_000343 /TAXON_ID=268821 /ORGANISM="Scrippsiella Hangoei, Strain SHTV-5" /LENGTH=56 /DNA_ID=CAMNT_0051162395 /DNA_START=18 /DNA_END=188 /DNA_ORIENTATION=-